MVHGWHEVKRDRSALCLISAVLSFDQRKKLFPQSGIFEKAASHHTGCHLRAVVLGAPPVHAKVVCRDDYGEPVGSNALL